MALSPDGATLVFAAGRGDSVRLYVRRLDSFGTRVLPGTEGGDSPFFSTDGRWVAFFSRKARQLRKVALAGGSSVVVAEDLARAQRRLSGFEQVGGGLLERESGVAAHAKGA